MESDDTIISETSLYNYYKIYQRIEIENHSSQRLVRVYLQNKDNELEDWYVESNSLYIEIGEMSWTRLEIQYPVTLGHGQSL